MISLMVLVVVASDAVGQEGEKGQIGPKANKRDIEPPVPVEQW